MFTVREYTYLLPACDARTGWILITHVLRDTHAGLAFIILLLFLRWKIMAASICNVKAEKSAFAPHTRDRYEGVSLKHGKFRI